MENRGSYTRSEIKFNIRTVIQKMLYNHFGDEEATDIINEMKFLLEEEFEIIE